MADTTYQPKIYKKDGGDTLVVASGGTISIEAGGSLTGNIVALQAAFVEDATTLTHTATFPSPAGATLLDIYAVPQVLWTDSSAALTIGDANSATGWFTSTNLAATDLILGERLQASQAVATDGSYGGTKEGAYVTTAGRLASRRRRSRFQDKERTATSSTPPMSRKARRFSRRIRA